MARREGLEPPTLRFEGESEPEEPPTLALQQPAQSGTQRHIAAPETADGTPAAPALTPIGTPPAPQVGMGPFRRTHPKMKRGKPLQVVLAPSLVYENPTS